MQVLTFLAQPPRIPIAPPIILCVALLASLAVFVTLTRRWTSHRVRIALADWARDNGFQLGASTVTLPPPLLELSIRHVCQRHGMPAFMRQFTQPAASVNLIEEREHLNEYWN